MDKKQKEVTNLIEPVLLTKLHIGLIGKAKLSDLMPSLKVVASQFNLKLNRVSDFRVAVKFVEEQSHLN